MKAVWNILILLGILALLLVFLPNIFEFVGTQVATALKAFTKSMNPFPEISTEGQVCCDVLTREQLADQLRAGCLTCNPNCSVREDTKCFLPDLVLPDGIMCEGGTPIAETTSLSTPLRACDGFLTEVIVTARTGTSISTGTGTTSTGTGTSLSTGTGTNPVESPTV